VNKCQFAPRGGLRFYGALEQHISKRKQTVCLLTFLSPRSFAGTRCSYRTAAVNPPFAILYYCIGMRGIRKQTTPGRNP
jgi:hypothetical protein